MAPSGCPVFAQQNTFQVLQKSEGSVCSEEVLVRLIHSWEARNFTKGNILMGVELLLIDGEGNTAKGFISASRLFRFEHALKANSVYKLQEFMVIPSKKLYKVTDHKYGLCFTDKTTMVEVSEGMDVIATQKFRLRKFSELATIADSHTDLFDVVGQLSLISGGNLQSPLTKGTAPEVAANRSEEHVFLHLLMEDGETVRVYLWGNIAQNFRTRWNNAEVQPVVILITTVNPKTIGGAVTLSSTSSTRLFFDSETSETKEFMRRFGDGVDKIPKLTSSTSAITKLETVSLKEIYQFIKNENPQEASFYCFATITDVLEDRKWYYISCSGCNSKLENLETSMTCNNCKKTNTVGLIRYRFEIMVKDKTGDEGTFVIFDTDGTKHSGRRASDVLQDSIEVEGERRCESVQAKIPGCIKNLIGRTYKFQVKIKEYNFRASRQTMTVSRIVGDPIVEDAETSTTASNMEAQLTDVNLTGNESSDMVEDADGKKKKRARLQS